MLLTSMPTVTVHRFTFTLSEKFCYVRPVKFLIRTNGSCIKLLELWFPNCPNYGPQTNTAQLLLVLLLVLEALLVLVHKLLFWPKHTFYSFDQFLRTICIYRTFRTKVWDPPVGVSRPSVRFWTDLWNHCTKRFWEPSDKAIISLGWTSRSKHHQMRNNNDRF